MQTYLNLLKKVMTVGRVKSDRTGTGTYSLFGEEMRFDLNDAFPILTTKAIHWHSVLHELLWFIRGDTHVGYLTENGVSIWNEWTTMEQCEKFNRPTGHLGPVYGHQWRNFGATLTASEAEANAVKRDAHANGRPVTYGNVIVDGTTMVYRQDGFDQLAWLVNEIKTNPDSRRLILSGWNPKEANEVCLPPCHSFAQFYVADGKLSCKLTQRSADVFLGVPFNIASYALLTHLIAHVCGLGVDELVWSGGDVHLYSNHLDPAHLQLARRPSERPVLKLDPRITDLTQFRPEHISLDGYAHQGKISALVAV